MNKVFYLLFLSLTFTFCNSKKEQDTEKLIVNGKEDLKIESKVDSISESDLPIYGIIDSIKLAKYFPNTTDTIKDLRIIGCEKIDLKNENEILISLLHNTGTFDQMILCTHDKKLKLIDHLYIGKATSFDNGKSHTIDYFLNGNDEIVFNQVDWGYVYNHEGEENIDTIKFVQQNITITKSGEIKSTKTIH